MLITTAIVYYVQFEMMKENEFITNSSVNSHISPFYSKVQLFCMNKDMITKQKQVR